MVRWKVEYKKNASSTKLNLENPEISRKKITEELGTISKQMQVFLEPFIITHSQCQVYMDLVRNCKQSENSAVVKSMPISPCF